MRAGQLRHVVTVQTNSSTSTNTFGEFIQTWSTATTRRARVEPISVSEGDGVKQTRATANLKITMRYYSGLSPETNRITWQNRTFGIVGVQHLDNRERDGLNGATTVAMVREIV